MAAEATLAQKRASGKVWMLGVIGVYSTFALGTLAVVGFTFTQNVELVTKRHYEEGVRYQERIDNAQRAAQLQDPIQWSLLEEGRVLEISYPTALAQASSLQGMVRFLRPSSSEMDINIPIQLAANGKQRISLHDIPNGFWILSVECTANGAGYYKEAKLHIKK